MKRIALIVVLVGAIAAFVIVPMLKNDKTDYDYGFPASFGFENSLVAATYGKDASLPIVINDDNVTKIELIFNDSVFQTFDGSNKKMNYVLDADFYGVGAFPLTLRSYTSDGRQEDDERTLRVLSDISPVPKKAVSVVAYPHERSSYTQGLEWNNGKLYESTGNPRTAEASSMVGIIDLPTGKILTKNGLDASYFGEGITIIGDELFQLTWQNGKCFVYDKNNLQLKLRDFTYTGEGWGLTNDGKSLIMSDGSERIYFRDPKTFSILKTIEVYDNIGPRVALNELEYINGKLYANVYLTDFVLVIDPNTGKVLENIDCSGLEAVGKEGGEVLNGIAWNPATAKLYMTGKYWGKLMEVKITD